MSYFSRSELDGDEVLVRRDVTGTCWSKRCSGRRGSATKTMYRNGDQVIRCTACKADSTFVEDGDDAYQSGRNYSFPDEVREKDRDFTNDRYQRRRGRR